MSGLNPRDVTVWLKRELNPQQQRQHCYFSCVWWVILFSWFFFVYFNPKKSRESHFDPLCHFSINVSSKERVKPLFFVTFNVIISHIFPENFIEILQIVQNLWIISLSILTIFVDFHRFCGFFDISLLQRN